MIQVTPTKFVEYGAISFKDRQTGNPKTVPVIKFIGTCQVPDATGMIPPEPTEARFTIWPQNGGLPTLDSLAVNNPVAVELAKEANPGNDGKRRFSIKPGPGLALTVTENEALNIANGGAGPSTPGYTPSTPAAPAAPVSTAQASRMTAAEATIMILKFHKGVVQAAALMGVDLPPAEAATHARQLVIGVDRRLSLAPDDAYDTAVEAMALASAITGSDEPAKPSGDGQINPQPSDDDIPF